MANISYDGNSFTIDGQSVWLVCGTIDYARVPHRLWRSRIRAARQAGLNTIVTAVFWNLHEPQPGVFRFEEQADLRRFVQLIGEEGMWCWLRPGPFVNSGWDMGGLPAWLLEADTEHGAEPWRAKLRQDDPLFLQAAARFLDAVMGQVRDLQVTEPRGGPLILMQSEHEWFCHNERQADAYLEQINRFLRESGCAVPLVNTNNLYQQVPGTIDGWDGDADLFTNCRQLRVLRPDAPCLVSSLPTGSADVWGGEHVDDRPAAQLLRRMVEASATGAMFNLDPFCGGTNFGFYGGRYIGGDDRFATTSRDGFAPLSEAGARRGKYAVVKRFCTFLDQFHALMANLSPTEHHTVATGALSIVQQSGSQGQAVFILPDERSRAKQVELVTPDGQTLPVDLGGDAAAWVVLNANLGGVATLNLTNLRPLAFLGRRLLVLFGPAGSEALLSIDGTLLAGEVPRGNNPLVMRHNGLSVAVLNRKQADAAYIAEEGLYVGVGGLDEDDRPLPHPGFGGYCHITLDGEARRHRRRKVTHGPAPRLGKWEYAPEQTYVDGSAPRYATIEGPRCLEACGADFGYGWYRLRLKRPRAKKVSVTIPGAADRLHLYADGRFRQIIGFGPNASPGPIRLDLSAGESELVFLADNLGRFSEDLPADRPKGLCRHLLEVRPVRLNKPEVSHEPRADPFELSGYVPHCTTDDRRPHPRYTFSFNLPGKSRMVLTLSGERPRSVILFNNKPVAIDPGGNLTLSWSHYEHLKKGRNRLTFALIDQPEADGAYDPRSAAALHRVTDNLSEKAEWWYARWQMPDPASFEPMPKTTPNIPTFFRTTFSVGDVDRPLMLEIDGPSKGQVYLNGHNVGRYFVATHTGRAVGPQSRYYLPEPWLSTEEPNELILFDEHGKQPTRCKLVYDEFGPFGE